MVRISCAANWNAPCASTTYKEKVNHMDTRNVIALRSYANIDADAMIIHIDPAARESLGIGWGEMILVRGRRDCTAEIRELEGIDRDGNVARITTALRDALMVEYGDGLLLSAHSG